MLFQSYEFLLLFLPFSVVVFLFLKHKQHNSIAYIFLLLMNLVFYAYADLCFLLFLLVQTISVYLIGRKLLIHPTRILLTIGILINLTILFYFKYLNFSLKIINDFLGRDFVLLNIILPLGISFYIFTQIAFLIDCYRNKIKNLRLRDYLLFITFFPKIIQGPIMLYQDFSIQIKETENIGVNWDNIKQGIVLLILGLSKKVLIADVLALMVNTGYDNLTQLTSSNAWFLVLCFTLQIYFDFSGYSDMAIGIGKLFQFELPMNFNSPYRAISIQDFWSRWHISLTNFFTHYVYIPLGGNRKGKLRLYINIMIIFTLSGLWHGAAYTFIIWGILHGICSCIDKMMYIQLNKIPVWIRWSITFLIVNLAWVLFRAESFSQACEVFRLLFDVRNLAHNLLSLEPFLSLASSVLSIETLFIPYYPIVIMIIALGIVFQKKNTQMIAKSYQPNLRNAMILGTLLFYCLISLSGVSTFLYTQF